MEFTQEMLEQTCSGTALGDRLFKRVEEGLDSQLQDWLFMLLTRVDQAISIAKEGGYYDSKNQMLLNLKRAFNRVGFDNLATHLAAIVLRDPEPQTLQQVTGAMAYKMPEDAFESPDEMYRAAFWFVGMGSATPIGRKHVTPPWMLYGIYRRKREMSQVKVPESVRKQVLEILQAEGLPEQINNTFTTPPFVQPPLPVTNRHNCGYYTFSIPLISGKYTQHDGHVNTKVINVLNGIQWVLDKDVLAEPEVVPLKIHDPHMLSYSKFLYNLYADRIFWLNWRFDSRGRMVQNGYHIHFQSYHYKKMALSFNKYEYLD
jgi:hypothetical protein